MANEVNEIEAGARINHLVYRDVYNTTFQKDTIVDMEMSDDGSLSGMCQTSENGWLPVFYHCKKHCYDESVRTLQANGSLKGGVLAFEVEGEVKVLLEENIPKYVIGHFEQYNPPCMCKDIFRINLSKHSGGPLEGYFVGSAEKMLEGNVDYYGDTPLCEREEPVLFEYWTYYPSYYHGQRYNMVRVGPMLYTFYSHEQHIYASNHTYASIGIYSYGAWTQEKEDALIVAGQNPFPIGDTFYMSWPEGGVYLREFSDLICEDFLDYYSVYQGKDMRTVRFYGQSDEEE